MKVAAKFFYKTYQREDLLVEDDVLQKRISLINHLQYDKYNALLTVVVYAEGDTYIYKQAFLKKQPRKAIYHREDFYDIIDALEYFHSVNFVHGDINRKNIIYTSEGFKIIDFEPALYQIKNNRKQLMVTLPYVSKKEAETQNLTSLTDKLGFYYFVLRVNNNLPHSNIIKLGSQLNHYAYIGMSEHEFSKLPYMDILNMALNN